MDVLYEDYIFHSIEVLAPLLLSLHDGQELPIVHVVVLLSTYSYNRVEVDRFENPKSVLLVENAGYGHSACICRQNNRL
jgi:hypothetical protein